MKISMQTRRQPLYRIAHCHESLEYQVLMRSLKIDRIHKKSNRSRVSAQKLVILLNLTRYFL